MQLHDSSVFFVVLFACILLLQYIWNRVRHLPEWAISDRAADLLFCIFLSIAVGTFLRLYPGNHQPPEWDSAVFLYIGRRMTEGKIPYLELFDHKGPLLFFVEYIGCLLTPESYTGVWLLEILTICGTLYISCRTLRLLSDNRTSIFISVIFTYFLCGWKVWQGGNFSEEYALPWISAALYVFLHFFKTHTYKSWHIIILGLSFTAVFLLRANMVAIWIAWIPVVLLELVLNKRYTEIWHTILLFCAGVAILLIPTVLFALKTNSLSSMWRYYILFNFSYTGHVQTGSSPWMQRLFSMILQLWPGFLAVAVGLLQRANRKLHWLNFLFLIISIITVQMSGRSFVHYQIQLLPCFILPFCSLSKFCCSLFHFPSHRNPVPYTVIIGTVFLIMIASIGFRNIRSDTNTADEPVIAYLKDYTQPEDDILVLGNNAWVYLAANRKTENPFFYQSPPIEISDTIYQAFLDALNQFPSDYIITTFGETEVVYSGAHLSEVCSKLSSFGYQYEDHGSFGVYKKAVQAD